MAHTMFQVVSTSSTCWKYYPNICKQDNFNISSPIELELSIMIDFNPLHVLYYVSSGFRKFNMLKCWKKPYFNDFRFNFKNLELRRGVKNVRAQPLQIQLLVREGSISENKRAERSSEVLRRLKSWEQRYAVRHWDRVAVAVCWVF